MVHTELEREAICALVAELLALRHSLIRVLDQIVTFDALFDLVLICMIACWIR